MINKTDREICAAATDGPWNKGFYDSVKCRVGTDEFQRSGNYICSEDGHHVAFVFSPKVMYHMTRFNPQKVIQMLDRQEQLKSKLKEASEFIQKLGPTIDYDIVAEIEEMLGE